MKRIILAIALCLVSTGAFAQCNGAFQPNTFCGNNTSATRPPFQISGTTSITGPGSSTSGDIVTFSNNFGNALGDSGKTFGTSGATVPILNANNFFTGTTSLGTVNIVSSFVWDGTTYTFPTNGTSLAALQGANTWTSANTFTGPLTIGTSLFTLPVSPINGGTGNTSLTPNALLVGEGTAPTSAIAAGTTGQYLGGNLSFSGGPWTLLSSQTISTSTAAISDTTHITSVYNDYEIVIKNFLPLSPAVTCELQPIIASTVATSGYVAGGNGTSGAQTSTTFIQCSVATVITSASASSGVSGFCRLTNANNTTLPKVWVCQTGGNATTTWEYWAGGGAVTTLLQAVNGFQLSFSTGSIASAIMEIYGRN